jgi:Nif-specific regulatory protein
MVIMSESDCIPATDLPANLGMPEASPHRAALHATFPDDDLSSQVEELERRKILHALKKNNFVQQRASRALGITPRQLGYRLKKYGINPRGI